MGEFYQTDYAHKEVYIHILDYDSAMKEDEITPSGATWTDLEIIILSETVSDKDNYVESKI